MNPEQLQLGGSKYSGSLEKGRRSTTTRNSTEHSLAAGPKEEAEKPVANKD